MNTENKTDLFASIGTTTAATESNRTISEYTGILVNKSNSRASELMLNQAKTRPDLTPQVQKVLQDLNPQDLAELLVGYFAEKISEDAELLVGCPTDQLERMLESRRSDRSHTRSKNPASNAGLLRTYISAMYAELLIRVKMNKPYSSQTSTVSEVDQSDIDAVNRRIRSLQSKKTRLTKLAKYDDSARKELNTVNTEINRLQALRPNSVAKTETIVKSMTVDSLRETLKQVDRSKLSSDEQAKYDELISRLA